MLSTLAQFGYFAILVQAFVVPPPLKSFRPCGCIIIEPVPIKRLILLNHLPSSQNLTAAHGKANAGVPGKNCGRAQSLHPNPSLKRLELAPVLERLLFSHSSPVELCIELNASGKTVSANVDGASLSEADERLIASYILDNWEFWRPSHHAAAPLAGLYSFTLGVHQELQW